MPFLLAMLLAQPVQAGGGSELEARIRALVAASGAEVAVALRTLDGRDEVWIDADRPMHAASTMKVPVMIALFAEAESGRLSLDEPLPVSNTFRSIADGTPYALDPAADSDKALYDAIGGTRTLRDLCRAMIAVSSNLATNLLIERIGVERITSTVARLGADGMRVLRGVEDGKAFARGLNNTTTARALLVLFEKLARGEAVGPGADAAMIDVLEAQQFREGIPAGLPRGVRVAHKTGNITRIHHDAGIVFGERPYVLVVMVRGIEDPQRSGAVIADISRTAFQSLAATR